MARCHSCTAITNNPCRRGHVVQPVLSFSVALAPVVAAIVHDSASFRTCSACSGGIRCPRHCPRTNRKPTRRVLTVVTAEGCKGRGGTLADLDGLASMHCQACSRSRLTCVVGGGCMWMDGGMDPDSAHELLHKHEMRESDVSEE